MNPGRDLDALVAEKVMGWENNRNGPSYRGERACQIWALNEVPVIDCPCYSTDIAAAWEVVERLPQLFREINPATDGLLVNADIEQSLDSATRSYYFVRFEFDSTSFEAESHSLPHAICLAALKAMGVETERAP